MTKVSVVLNVLEDEPWIVQCLACLAWADEIVVTDMGASDQTRTACTAAGARILPIPVSPTVEPARVAGVEAATNEWILVLDPDELIPASLATRLQQVSARNEADVVFMSWRNYLLGREIRHAGWGMHPDRHARFFRKGSLAFSPVTHSVPAPSTGSRILILDAVESLAVVHFNYTDVSSFLRKLNRYSTAEARDRSSAPPPSGRRAAQLVVREVWTRWVTYRGFRDGWRGTVLSLLQGSAVLATWAKQREMWENGGHEGILRSYEAVAAEVVRSHDAPGLSSRG